jgi:hypothetical protein
MAETDALWGGQLTAVRFDPVGHSCDLTVRVTTGGTDVNYTVRCDQVTSFEFTNAIAEPWDYAEVTEADLATDASSGLKTLELVLWSEDAGLKLSARSIDVAPV